MPTAADSSNLVPVSAVSERPTGLKGILRGVAGLDSWLPVTLVILTLASTARYLNGHGLGDRAPLILGAATALLALYAASPLVTSGGAAGSAYAWCLGLVALWLGLVVLAPSFAWLAVPLAFVALQVLPFRAASAVVALMLAAVVIAWSSMQGSLDPTIIAGPACIAGLAVVAYRSLEREGFERQELVHELQDAEADLASAQHAAGALSERSRLSRDIHDSVAQALSSINLLLQAADQHWVPRPDDAREYVQQASLTARDGLQEVRSIVHDLAPTQTSTVGAGSALPEVLAQTCEQAMLGSGIGSDVLVHGEPITISDEAAAALIRSVRGALANVIEHSNASRVTVSLTYQPDSILLDVRDNGSGFESKQTKAKSVRGRGLAGIRARAEQFGGGLVVESAPGEGTTLAISLPMGGPS